MSSSAPSSTTGGQPASLTTVIDGRHHLVGSRCNSCGTHSFPTQAACSRCGAATADVALPATGTVWTWTVQRLQPKPPYRGPEPFQPFAVGYVDLGPLRVESPLTGHSVDEWRIGETVELVVASNDEPVRSFAFAAVPPAGNGPAPQTEAAT